MQLFSSASDIEGVVGDVNGFASVLFTILWGVNEEKRSPFDGVDAGMNLLYEERLIELVEISAAEMSTREGVPSKREADGVNGALVLGVWRRRESGKTNFVAEELCNSAAMSLFIWFTLSAQAFSSE